ncbi:Cytochrome c oxidase assembly protein COX11 mitochondrial [Dissostichus eleginoides]|uniref:Cytochrome c oxidase assembly protein COX11, mitochondrial n=1 Tax=Dissostichus eleginoides TaxID=100907 RepID=A0AAD9BEG0_DISEL|nr:Cytochrome c oxidase assembly protein COX11 mitochondrial [Dissostichus eleginoides]
MLFQLLRAPLCGAPSVLPRCVRSLRSAPCRTPAMRPRLRPRPEDPEDPEPGGGVEEPEQTLLTYIAAAGVVIRPIATGLGGAATAGHDTDQVETMEPVKERILKITFNADTHSSMQWNFRPQQSEIYVVPGETALAFYRAKNPTNKHIIGISTYNVVPFDAGQYFNKIQCFCFEEQRLNPHEEVDMPVFFYIDPEFDEDPRMARVDTITLSYTFFEAKEGQKIPLPGYSYS